ncbi:hypothetical protein [Rhodobacter capsulatus]|uniref:hypothetical protein n=1 Tax=Rhodobacter capsulatus TaxID=1061 RepID=UPI00146B0B5C|nr:hypothetical protein [Rhodobacter capsulatus]
MPRKNPRPAAKKRAAKIAAKAALKTVFKRRAAPILARPRANDRLILAALSADVYLIR